MLREMERALNRENQEGIDILFPIRLDDHLIEEWAHPRRDDVLSKVVGDFRGWNDTRDNYETAFKKLLEALLE